MAECPACEVENVDEASTCWQCNAPLYGLDPECRMPTFGGTSTGQVLERRYVILRKIGSDGIGIVYQAEDAETNRAVLLRALPAVMADNPEQISELRQVAKPVLNLSHPNIVCLLDCRLDGNVKYLVTEYVEGISLEERLRSKGPLSLEQVVEIFGPLAGALDHAHACNILHRDICPSNVVVGFDGRPKLANFAITRQLKGALAQITCEQADGASLYAAPEQFRTGRSQRRSDIYSFAATIYRCLCRPPTTWRGWVEYQVLKEEPAALHNLSDAQNAVLLKALSFDARNRYGSAEEFLRDLSCARGARRPAVVPGGGRADYLRRAAEASEKLKVAMEARVEAERKARAEARARAEAEDRLKNFRETIEELKADAREKQKHYAEQLTQVQQMLFAEAEARRRIEEDLKAEMRRLSKLEAEAAEGLAEARDRLKAEAAARAEAEKKAKAEAEERARLEAKLKHQAQAVAEQAAESKGKGGGDEDKQVYKQALAEARRRAEVEAAARAAIEEKLKAESEARAESEEQLQVYVEELARAQEKIKTESSLGFDPEEDVEPIAADGREGEGGGAKPGSRVKLAVTLAVVLVAAVVGALGGYRYLERLKAPPSAKQAWSRAQLLAARQNYAEAISAAELVIREFPRFAVEQDIERIKATWQNDLAAGGVWSEAEQLAGRSQYEAAITLAERVVAEYPRSLYAAKAESALLRWKELAVLRKKTLGFIAEARTAKDANDLDAALRAVGSALALDPNNAEAGILKAEIEAAIRTEERLRRIAAEQQRQFEQLVARAAALADSNDWQGAIDLYTKASALRPDDRQVASSLAFCRYNLNILRGRSEQAEGDLEAAIESYTRALSWADDPEARVLVEGMIGSLQARLQADRLSREVRQWLRKAAEAEAGGDLSAAVAWYRQAAEANDPGAMYKLALAYYEGRGVPQDLSRTSYWLTKAGDAGYAEAMYRLGLMYEAGEDIPRDYARAIEWYTKGAEAGHSGAMHRLGMMYYSGEGAGRDVELGMKWLERAAEAGNTQAMYNLAVAYYNGEGSTRDYAKAVEWFRKAADANDVLAMYNLALAYLDVSDYSNAMHWFGRAAEAGNVEAMYNLGVMHYKGYGAERDYGKALHWYLKAAEGGDTSAMVNLGLMYHDGLGTAKDPARAVEWYRRAAQAGNTRAMSNLAMAYYHGDGIAKDPQAAIRWLREAAEKGENMAMFNLALMYQNGWTLERDLGKAAEWYTKAAEAGDPQAMYNLALMYRRGEGVRRDAKKAVSWFQKAARLGHPQAKKELLKLGETW